MRLNKKQWLMMQLVALLVVTGGVFLIRPHLARAVSVNPSSMTGFGLPGMPYEITNCTELQDINLNLTASYRLMNDIDCSDTINWNSGAGFSPIGQNSNAFNGSLDGHGHTINGLYISQMGAGFDLGFTALFAQSDPSALFLNFKVTAATIVGNGQSGNSGAATAGVVATMYGGLMDRVHFSGVISVPGCNSRQTIGGIIGKIESSPNGWLNVSSLSSEGAITVTGTNCGQYATVAGGLIGASRGYSVVDSYSRMDISLTGQATSDCFEGCRALGGLIGLVSDASVGARTSYYAGALTVASNETPHLTYAVGGIFGYQETSASIINSFSAATITVPADCDNLTCGSLGRKIGGITGNDNGISAMGAGNWSNAYFDQDRAGTTHCANGLDDTNGRCNPVNTDGLSPNYFGGLTPNVPISSNFDYVTPIWELTTSYPVLTSNPIVYPGEPTSLTTIINSTTSISVSWTAATGANGYNVLCRPTSGNWARCSDYTLGTGATITGLDPATQYEFKVTSTGDYNYYSNASLSVFSTTATPGFALISNCQELQDMNSDLSSYYELARDIDCSDTITWNNGEGFDPIGYADLINADFELFIGALKGNNYTIKNLYIDQSTTPDGNSAAGLFAATSGAIIQDLTLDQPVIIGSIFAAAVNGLSESTIITNVHVANGTVTGDAQALGGITGYTTNDSGKTPAISRSSFTGSITHTGSNPAGYMGGLTSYVEAGSVGGYIITDNYVNATITTASGATASGGLIGKTDTGDGGTISLARNYAAGSLTVAGAYPPPDFDSWIAGGLIGYSFGASSSNLTIANSFAHLAMSVSESQDLVGSLIGTQFVAVNDDSAVYTASASLTNLSNVYADANVAGTSQCIGNGISSNCNQITGQPNYFKNNSTNPPLTAWNFSNIWMTTGEFPVFNAAVTTGITTITNLPAGGGITCFTTIFSTRACPTGGPTGGIDAAVVSSTTDGGPGTQIGSGVASKAITTSAVEAGVLGAFKNFVRSLPAGVVIAFPYALFGLLLLAALILLIELIRELRRLRLLLVLIRKQQLLAEERDTFWHLAANYLRAPVTLIVGGAEALRESHIQESTTAIAALAASLQSKVAQIMSKIEGSASLQAINQDQPRKAAQVAHSAFFIVPVVSVAALTILANYAATSYRNLGPNALGYTTQLVGFIIAVVLFYWVLALFTQGKSRRKAAEAQLDRQTIELANARHELIAETASSLNPDLTRLEGMLHALPVTMAAAGGGALVTLGEGTSRLREIVTSFALLIKVQEGTGAVTTDPEASTVDLANILARTRAKLTPQIAAKGVRVIAPVVPLTVHAEADLANQVLESIISNAVDYSPANGTVRVEAKRLQDAILIRVSDEGQGIDKKQLDHLFQPFVRADGKSAMDMSQGGFGINLYLDKLIMEQMGGSISAASNPGKGTAITMTWPA